MAADASTWAAEHSAALIGMPAGAAEKEVTAAGLHARSAGPGAVLTLELRSDRITLDTDASGLVTAVRAG